MQPNNVHIRSLKGNAIQAFSILRYIFNTWAFAVTYKYLLLQNTKH